MEKSPDKPVFYSSLLLALIATTVTCNFYLPNLSRLQAAGEGLAVGIVVLVVIIFSFCSRSLRPFTQVIWTGLAVGLLCGPSLEAAIAHGWRRFVWTAFFSVVGVPLGFVLLWIGASIAFACKSSHGDPDALLHYG